MDELTSPFKMPVVFEVHYKDGTSSSKRVWLSHANDTVYISAPKGGDVDYTLFDPGSYILKTVDFKKSFDELGAQFVKTKNMIDRYDALVALKDFDFDKKRDLLIAIFNEGGYNAIQSEIVKQLAKDNNPSTIEMLARALHDKNFSVRRAVIENLDTIPAALLPEVEKLLTDSSYTNIELTLRKLVKQYPDKAGAYLDQTKGVKGVSDNVRIAWLELRAKESTNKGDLNNKYEKQLVPYTSNLYEFRTRIKAMDALDHTGYSDKDLIYNLFNASLYNNSRLSNPASKLLKTILKADDKMKAAKEVFATNKWADWEYKALQGFFK
jgi:hypothetical protein